MKTLFEVLNIDLAEEYTKNRKLAKLKTVTADVDLLKEAKAAIEAMDIPEDDERHHWINKVATKAAADLLTIGKVQPENMIAMKSLGEDNFKEAVKIATVTARAMNDMTIEAEKELNQDTTI